MKHRRTWIVAGSLALAFIAYPALSDDDLIPIKLPPGAIIGFVGLLDCPDNWEKWDIARGRFLRGVDDENAAGSIGGNPTHFHEGSTSQGGRRTQRGVDRDNDYHTSDITHSHTFTTDEQSNDPRYVSVLFCRLVGD